MVGHTAVQLGDVTLLYGSRWCVDLSVNQPSGSIQLYSKGGFLSNFQTHLLKKNKKKERKTGYFSALLTAD